MTDLQDLDEKVPRVKEALLNSVDEVKRNFSERFSWLSLKEVPSTEVGCVSDEEIEHFQKHANQLFPGIVWTSSRKPVFREFSQRYHGRRSILKNTKLFRLKNAWILIAVLQPS